MTTRATNYVFTIFPSGAPVTDPKYSFAEEQHLARLVDAGKLRYFAFGVERCPSTGRPHLQGFLGFSRDVRKSTVDGLLRPLQQSFYNTAMRGKLQDSVEYCSKASSLFVYGELPVNNDKVGQCEKERWDAALKNIKSANLDDIPSDIFIRYYGAIKSIASDYAAAESPEFKLDEFTLPRIPLEDLKVSSYVIHGPPGTGKTSFALAHFERPLLVSHMDALKAFRPGFHDGIIFDDMSFFHLPRESQIHIVDQAHTRQIHCRYAAASIPKNTPKIFTTNVDAGAIFLQDAAISRRIKKVYVPFAIHR